jgi:hypothetical protein
MWAGAVQKVLVKVLRLCFDYFEQHPTGLNFQLDVASLGSAKAYQRRKNTIRTFWKVVKAFSMSGLISLFYALLGTTDVFSL